MCSQREYIFWLRVGYFLGDYYPDCTLKGIEMRSDYEIALDIEKEQQAIKKFKELANLLANVVNFHLREIHNV